MRTLLIYAPIAGGGRGSARYEECRAELAAEAVASTSPGHAERLTAAAGGYDLVLAAGGDGTVHEVVNGLLQLPEPRPRLGVLPFGTGNDIARNLGIFDPSDTVQMVENGRCRRIDLIRVDLQREDRPRTVYGVLNCGIGFGAEVIRRTTVTVKRLFGPTLSYTVGTARALLPWHSPAMSITHDGGTFDGRVFFLAVGNGEWEGGGTMRMSPGAQLDDGLLNVLLIRHGSKLEVVRNFGKLSSGEHVHHPLCEYFTTRRLEATSDKLLGVQTDGDVVGQSPVCLTVEPRAVEVYAPPPTWIQP
ncbi:MAG: diacylglycerol kinase family lipid kinase [Armatimonadetes bacterium]|nr:diacylglycerol kinase family lipid kinase [Armatimonadota bacterium]